MLGFLFTVPSVVFGVPEEFSCERIQEKRVRVACINDRIEKQRADKEEKARTAAAEKWKDAEREKELPTLPCFKRRRY